METRNSGSTMSATARPTTRRASQLARTGSLAVSAERPAISECRCPTLSSAGLLNVPARERNQGSGLSRCGDGRPERAARLAAGEYGGRARVLVRLLLRWDLGTRRLTASDASVSVLLGAVASPGLECDAAGACERSLPTAVCVADELIADRGATVKDLPAVAGAGEESGGVENLEVLRDGAGCDFQPPGDLDGG